MTTDHTAEDHAAESSEALVASTDPAEADSVEADSVEADPTEAFVFASEKSKALVSSTPLKALNGTITFGFAKGEKQVSDAIAQNVRDIFKTLIEPFVKVTFVEVSGEADINVQLHDSEAYDYYAYELAHDVYLSRAYDNSTDTNGFQSGFGSHGFMSLLHEILHAMGLKHPGGYSATDLDSGPLLGYEVDNTTNSVMSYNFSGQGAITPMPYDIDALQSLFGVRLLNLEDTTYQFDSVYSFTDGTRSWGDATAASKLTLTDSGGNDRLDFSALTPSAAGYVLDVRADGILTTSEAYNSFSYAPKDSRVEETPIQKTSSLGTRLSFGTTIESIFGSQGNDTIFAGEATGEIAAQGGDDVVYGRELQNSIWGGIGNDQIWGGSANDQLIGDDGGATESELDGKDVLYGGGGNDSIWSGGGDDALYGQAGDDLLVGGGGNDRLQGTDDLVTSDRDQLYGGLGRDRFVLGNSQGAFYQGDGYAIIKDWEAGIDKLQLGIGQEISRYRLEASQILSEVAALDMGVYFNSDLIAVVQNTTSVTQGDFVFA
ncbi:MAG: hypothetical protein WBG63_13030 [Phormidesmis sp.]